MTPGLGSALATADPTPPPLTAPEAADDEVQAPSGAANLDPRAPVRLQPVRSAVVMIEIAALVVPRQHRLRYDNEFLAELYEMDAREQRRYAAGVLGQSLRLRAALRDRPPTD